ncbi:MAG TPA: hypothetical protein DGT21_01890 [Armatimonadetes bacterium]|nr:hypothetical protein [Armatimonadota bacterium]
MMELTQSIFIATLCLLNGPQYENLDYVLSQLAQAPTGAHIVVLPHMPFIEFETGNATATVRPFMDFARERGAYLALALTEKDGDRTYWSAILVGPDGAVVGKYRKAHALIDDLVDGRPISLGDSLPTFQTDLGPIAMTIGTDIYLPEVYEVMRMKGAELITWHHYPERFREHSTWEAILTARCIDSHAHLVSSMYADEYTYLTNRYSLQTPGAVWGRSMILSDVGVPLADTGFDDGVAMALVDMHKQKKDISGSDPRVQSIFICGYHTDRKALAPVAEPYVKPTVPEYSKRTCRLAVGYFDPAEIWVNEKVPQTMLDVIDMAAEIKPDLLLLSEQACSSADKTTSEVMDAVAEKARQMNCYIAIGGIAGYGESSVCHVWDRQGNIVYHQPIYWPRGFDTLEVFDTDFGRVGSHTCGDLFTPLFDRVLALKGAEIIIDPSQMWGGWGRSNETMLRARAADNAAWLACAHWNTSDPSLRSVIIDPYGQVVAASGFQRNGVVYYDIDLDDTRVYYAGAHENQPQKTESGYTVYRHGVFPEQRKGWREMIFAARRPELYGIIPTVTDAIQRHRPATTPYPLSDEERSKLWRDEK